MKKQIILSLLVLLFIPAFAQQTRDELIKGRIDTLKITYINEYRLNNLIVQQAGDLNSTKFYLAFKNQSRKPINICLKNYEGKRFYAENVKRGKYYQKFNTAGLPKGNYILEITTVDQKYKFTKSIRVAPGTPKLQIENKEVFYANQQ